MDKDGISRQGGARRRSWHHKQGYTERVFQEADERNTKDAQRRGEDTDAVEDFARRYGLAMSLLHLV